MFVILEERFHTKVKSTMFLFLRCGFGEGMEHPVHRGETMPIGLHDR